MFRRKKTAVIIIIAHIIFAFTGCSYFELFSTEFSDGRNPSEASSMPLNVQNEEKERTELEKIALQAYFKDSFNPFSAVSAANLNLIPLIYDPILKITPDYALEYYIAEGIEMTGTVCNIIVKQGIVFSDGTPLNAHDVVYSLEAARNGGYYSQRLLNIDAINLTGDYSLQIALKKADILFEYNLDIPVIKNGSGLNEEAIGSGRYVLSGQDSRRLLTYNQNWTANGREAPVYTEIQLIAVPDSEAGTSGVETGLISMDYSDLSAASRTGIGTATEYVPTNNMVYIGINGENEILADKNVRAAISKAVNRQTALLRGYSGYGHISDMPYNPLMPLNEETPEAYEGGLVQDIETARELLAGSGYSGQPYSDEIALELLIPAENPKKLAAAEYIAEELLGIGINIAVTEAEFEDYLLRVNSGNYDLYLGEIKLSGGMNLDSFFGEGAKYIRGQTEASAAYFSFLSGGIPYKEFEEIFTAEMPFIPLYFTNGAVVYSRGILTEVLASPSDMYYNIENWNR